jgi:hypothetical protein
VHEHVSDLVAPSEPVAASVVGNPDVDILTDEEHSTCAVDGTVPISHFLLRGDIVMEAVSKSREAELNKIEHRQEWPREPQQLPHGRGGVLDVLPRSGRRFEPK